MMDEPKNLRAGIQTAALMAAQLEQWQACGDRRVIFLDCYQRMTRNMLAALDGGEFCDPAWVIVLLDRFANRYFEALQAYERDRTAAPPVWRVAHDAAHQRDTLALQNLLLGVNAHINYDLVLVVAALLLPEWPQLSDEQRRQRYADYTYVNAIIARTTDEVQDELLEPDAPVLRIADALLGRVDEWLTEQLIAGWREEVWRQAVSMLEAPNDDARDALRMEVEKTTVLRAQRVLGQIAPF